MSKNLQQITGSLKSQLPSLQQKFFVGKIGVFGSFVHGDDNKKSDVDVLVDLSKPISMFRFLDLEEKLSEILGKKVDLVTANALKPVIRNQILNEVVYV